MSARHPRDRNHNSLLPLLAPPPPRATPSATSRHRFFPRSSIYDRSITPYYDVLSESDGTCPDTSDFLGEESDSSAGSVLERATAETTRTLAAEWESIERTLYDEEGPHVTRPQLVDECKQWKQLFPHLRVVGKRITIPEKLPVCHPIPEEEIFAMHYSDYEQFSESEDRHSESSFSDTTPQNSPRTRTRIPTESRLCGDTKLCREKSSFPRTFNEGLNDSFHSMLQITPLYPNVPSLISGMGKRHYSSILKSEMSSSKWMRNDTPRSPKMRYDRSSAKSFVSLDTRNYSGMAMSATERKIQNEARVCTAKPRNNEKLQPINSYQTLDHQNKKPSLFANGKIWLPPLRVEEEKNKWRSQNPVTRSHSKKFRRSALPRPFTLISEGENLDKF